MPTGNTIKNCRIQEYYFVSNYFSLAMLCSLQIMRSEFDDEALRKNKDPLLLTAAVGVGEYTINASYNIPEISKYVSHF